MAEIINEPGKAGCREYNAKGNPYKKVAFEDLPSYEAMDVRHRSWDRYSRTNFGPLVRWLHTQVGQPWNAVYSEAVKQLRNKHNKDWSEDLVQCVYWYVEKDIEMIKGVPYRKNARWGGYFSLSGRRDGDLYINPLTDTLELYKAPKMPRTPKPVTFKIIKKLTDAPAGLKPHLLETPEYWYEAYQKIGGVWYFVKGYACKNRYHWRNIYRENEQTTVFKRQLNGKEMKQNSFVNDTNLKYVR